MGILRLRHVLVVVNEDELRISVAFPFSPRGDLRHSCVDSGFGAVFAALVFDEGVAATEGLAAAYFVCVCV